ncbi:MAG: glycosyltransferase family 4 protein [Limisphaerales bacterium]
MNVAIPISRFDSSGGIRVLTVLANGLAARGYHVSFVVPRGRHSSYFPLHKEVSVHVIGHDAGDSLIGGLIKKVQLGFGVPRNQHAVIANAFMTAYSVKFNKLIGRTERGLYFVQHYEPMAFGEHGHGPSWLKRLKTKAAEYTYSLGLECVTNSQWTARMLREKHHAESIVAPLGVDTAIFHPNPVVHESEDRSSIIMAIGNNNPIKRFGLFAETAQVLQSRRNFNFRIASHNPSLFQISGVEAAGISPKNDHEMARLYHEASVFVSTSESEGFGLPLLEAMACGTPVVTTDSGGIHDFCKNRMNCIIVPSARAEDLADAVMEIVSNHELRNKLIKNGLDTAKLWTWERLIDVFDRLLKECEE